MPHLALYLFGPPRFELEGAPLEIERRKAIALLVYLAVTGQSYSRDALATLLWPEYDQSRARAALRRTLSVLNKALQGSPLEIDRETVALKQSQEVWIDLDQFRQQLMAWQEHGHPEGELCPACRATLAEAVALYRADFLAGFTLPDSPDFEEWRFFQNENLRRELAGALTRLISCHTAQADYEAGLGYARRWAALDPWHEPAQRCLMELYAWSGQPAAALRQYQEYTRMLQAELDISPSEELTALYERIRVGKVSQKAETPARPEDSTTLPGAAPSFLTSASPPPTASPPFVAREPELAQLQGYLEKMLAGQGQVVLITGDAGSGKTALAHEFARRAQHTRADLIVAGGNCNAYTGLGDPYLPFREILGLLSGDIEHTWTQGAMTPENAQRLWAVGPLFTQILREHGPDLMDRFVSGPTLTRGAAGPAPGQPDGLKPAGKRPEPQVAPGQVVEAAQEDLFEQLTNALQALTQKQPLLLLIDDAQWADVASISLLFHLSRKLAGCRMLLLVAYRSDELGLGRNGQRHPLESVINEIKRLYGQAQLDLSQLRDQNFVEAFLDVQPNRLGPAFRATLYQRTQGHPLFTVELLRAMQERGDIVQDEQGRWIEGATLNWEALPARVEAVIEERINRLGEELREILAVASVEGETFTAQVAARVQKIDERPLLRQLSQVLEKQHRLLREQGELQVGDRFLSRYQFAHTLFQQHLYHQLSAGERRLLHGEIAAALEELYAGRTEEITVQLARHYREAGQVEQAVIYLLRAGDQARGLHAHQEAIELYQQALTFLKASGAYERAARTLMKLGLTYHLAFNFQQARQAYHEGFALWQRASMSQLMPQSPAPHPLRIIWLDPLTLDPTLADDDTSGVIIKQLFSGLVTLNPELDVAPEIAHSWEVLEGGRSYVFHLRDDVRWSDGRPVTAEDFIYAWGRVLDPASGSPNPAYLFDIKGAKALHRGQLSEAGHMAVRALDAVTLAVELERPTSYFPQLLAQPQLFPVPRHMVERYGPAWTEPEHIVTNGAFNLARWQPGQGLILERNSEYRGHFSGNVQQVTLALDLGPSADLSERLARYEADQIDLMPLFLSPAMHQIQARYAAEYFSRPVLNTQYIGFNLGRPPFEDPRVRRAFALSIDHEALATVIRSSHNFPATGGFLPPGMPGHSAGIGLPYDPEQARQLLAEAGYPAGRNFPITAYLAKGNYELESNYLQQQWAEILGVKIVWKAVAWERLLDQFHRGPPSLFRVGWVADYPDPDSMLRIGPPLQWIKWQNETYIELVEKARRIPNQAERMKLYQQADKMLIEAAVLIPLIYGRWHFLIKPWVSKYPTSALGWHFWKDVVIEPH